MPILSEPISSKKDLHGLYTKRCILLQVVWAPTVFRLIPQGKSHNTLGECNLWKAQKIGT